MRDLLKLWPIYTYSIAAQLIFNYVNLTFLFSKIKSGNYSVPFFGPFASLEKFTVAAWLFNSLAYITATILVARSYRLSVESSGGLYSALIVGQIAAILVSTLFMRLIVGEVPTRNGWIAIALALCASLFAANSGRNV